MSSEELEDPAEERLLTDAAKAAAARDAVPEEVVEDAKAAFDRRHERADVPEFFGAE